MVVSMEPMIMIPEGQKGAGGYREHDILVITEKGNKNITGFPYGPEHLIVKGRGSATRKKPAAKASAARKAARKPAKKAAKKKR